MATLSVLSTEYLNYTVTALIAGDDANPTTDTVSFAFTQNGAEPSDWFAGSWDTYPDGSYVAKVLVGPANGGVSLAVGAYTPWIKITDNPEAPVRQLPTLNIV